MTPCLTSPTKYIVAIDTQRIFDQRRFWRHCHVNLVDGGCESLSSSPLRCHNFVLCYPIRSFMITYDLTSLEHCLFFCHGKPIDFQICTMPFLRRRLSYFTAQESGSVLLDTNCYNFVGDTPFRGMIACIEMSLPSKTQSSKFLVAWICIDRSAAPCEN